MTNKEKHKLSSGTILANVGESTPWFCSFAKKNILKLDDCCYVNCYDCLAAFELWLDEEAEEEPVDWSKVKQGTLIEASNDPEDPDYWFKRYFIAQYNGKLVAADEFDTVIFWKCGRLLTKDKEGAGENEESGSDTGT